MCHTLVEAVLNHADKSGALPALMYREVVLSYHDVAERMKKMAFLLNRDYRISAGSKVMIEGLSRPEYILAFLAVQYLHAITIPFDEDWMEKTVMTLYDFSEPDLILTDISFRRTDIRAASLSALYAKAETVPAAAPVPYRCPDADKVGEMIFTTGTTGTPKGVMLTYGNILTITQNNIEGTGFQETDVLLNPLPLCHSLGLRLIRMAFMLGASVVLQNGFSDTDELRHNIDTYRCTAFGCVPAVIENLTRKIADFGPLFSQFRLMEIGSGSLTRNMKKRLPQLLPKTRIINTWGTSETGGVIFLDVSHRMDKAESIGKPVSNAEVTIVDPASGNEIEATDSKHAGLLAVRGKMVMAGYYNLPKESHAALADGWLITHDLVFRDEDGFFYMLGRTDDIINVGGEKVSPLEVENEVTMHPHVHDALCLGVEDPIMGQVPALFVVLEDPCRTEDVKDYLKRHLERYKRPSYIIKVDEIPRNRMKKPDRKAARKLWNELHS